MQTAQPLDFHCEIRGITEPLMLNMDLGAVGIVQEIASEIVHQQYGWEDFLAAAQSHTDQLLNASCIDKRNN